MNSEVHKRKRNYILVYGYGYSGSGAVIDLLKEVRGVHVSDGAYLGLRGMDGLLDLEYHLLDSWDMCKSSEAVERFIHICKRSCNPRRNPFTRFGLDYTRWFSKKFIQHTLDFVEEITKFRYYSYDYEYLLHHGYVGCFYSRMTHVLDKCNCAFFPPIVDMPYLTQPTKEEFFTAARKYIDAIYESQPACRWLVLDHHPLPVQFAHKMEDYFGQGTKMIVVDRDPRCIFCSLIKHRVKIGVDMVRDYNVDKYIQWHRALRAFKPNHPAVMYLRLEDMVLEYENTIKKIFSFLNINLKEHIQKKKYFTPEISIKNLDNWKRYQNWIPANVFNEIREKLPEDSFEIS